MINDLKIKIKELLEKEYEIDFVVEEPKNKDLGDISIPVFSLVKKEKKDINTIADMVIAFLEKKLSNDIKSIVKTGGFINITLSKEELSYKILKEVKKEKNNYANSEIGFNKTVVLDYSSPNIAKSFSIGHLRSTMIGNSLKLIYEKCGYKTISINYLGDWGTQFGKMIVAIQKYSSKEEIDKNPVSELTRLYVKFNQEAKKDPKLDDEAREAFKKMEEKDPEYLKLWEFIKNESLKESQEIYDLLEVKFDSYNGEAYYNDKMDFVVDMLSKKNLLIEDDGALIVRLDDMPPALIKRRDGASLYLTRDLSALFIRKKDYSFDKILYVVGNEQKLHFNQIKEVVKKLGYDFYKDIEHVNFGLYLKDGKKMSTREGNVVKLIDVLFNAINLALKQINEKNPNLKDKEEVAKYIGIAAVIFADLKNSRENDIEFDLNSCVKFEGQTGPYIQYTACRISSILDKEKYDINKIDKTLFDKPHYFEIVRQIESFKEIIEKACNTNSPSVICKYLISISQSFNKFYSIEKIISDNNIVKNTNLLLLDGLYQVLSEGLRLLGIHVLKEM